MKQKHDDNPTQDDEFVERSCKNNSNNAYKKDSLRGKDM